VNTCNTRPVSGYSARPCPRLAQLSLNICWKFPSSDSPESPLLYTAAAPATALCGFRQLCMPMVLGHRVVSLQKPARDHLEVTGRLHVKFGPDPLRNVASFREQRTKTNKKYIYSILDYIADKNRPTVHTTDKFHLGQYILSPLCKRKGGLITFQNTVTYRIFFTLWGCCAHLP